MQNELDVGNNVLNLKEFLSLQDKKEVSKVIYWNWAEETGDTEEEIHENDLKDSEFMGKKLQMAISVTGKQAMSANNNYYMVTLDANGGKIGSSTSVQKQVVYDESYGELPVPTRAGYTFAGWSRNKVGSIDDDNYYTEHYYNRTSSEIRNDGSFGELNNQNYYRIYGNNSNSNIDTRWQICGKNIVEVKGGQQYILSFYVRSEKSKVDQYIANYIYATGGKTCITWSDGTQTYLHEAKRFNNDGNWYLITEEFVAPDSATTATLTIGSDIPNLYGEGSYIDIGGIQFTEGSSINTMYITFSTRVTEEGEHTLYAKWIKNN